MSALDFCLDNCSALSGSVIDAARVELAALRERLETQAVEMAQMLTDIDTVIAERDHWIANHDDKVNRLRMLTRRLDLNAYDVTPRLKLLDELDDWRNAAKAAVLEECCDERHCSCVGVLRARIATLEKADEILSEIAACGVSYADERINYVEVQIDRDTWFNDLAPYRAARENAK